MTEIELYFKLAENPVLIFSDVLDDKWNLYVPSSILCKDEWCCMEEV